MMKNYTSTVAPLKSIMGIEKELIAINATNISKNIKDGKVISITFQIIQNSEFITIVLPCRVDKIVKYLKINVPKFKHMGNSSKVTEQAERTAWKNLLEWTQLQSAFIQLEQVEVLEVFLPYIYLESQQQTVYQGIKSNNFKALTN